jgi:tellurite resistance protein
VTAQFSVHGAPDRRDISRPAMNIGAARLLPLLARRKEATMSDTIALQAAPAAVVTTAWGRHTPLAIFASVMGVTAVGLCWRAAASATGVPAVIGEALLAAGALHFVLAATLYGAKLARYRQAVVADARHPVRGGFLGLISISLLLLAKAALPWSAVIGVTLAALGMLFNLGVTVLLFGRWIADDHGPEHVAPTWLIPSVANLLVPFVGLGGAVPSEVAWFFFGVGMAGWVPLLPLVVGRLCQGPKLPEPLRPTIHVMVAPPAVAFLSYSGLVGAVDGVARVLFYMALALMLVMLALARWRSRPPFGLSWWAFTMPSAAVILATFRYDSLTDNALLRGLAMVALLALSALLGVVAYRTLSAAGRGRLFVAE